MSVLLSKDNKDLIVTCDCGCDEAMHITVENDDDTFSYISYLNGNFYKEQGGVFASFKEKLKRIISIIQNKDYYYSDIVMTKEDWEIFKNWINQQ